MALPNAWTTINVGDEIEVDDHLTDLKANADYLHDNAACGAHNATYDATQNQTVDADKDATVDAARDIGYDATQRITYDNDQNTGVNSARDIGYDAALYTNVYNPRYLTNYNARNYAVYSNNYSTNKTSKQ